jgi:hypothetical protein
MTGVEFIDALGAGGMAAMFGAAYAGICGHDIEIKGVNLKPWIVGFLAIGGLVALIIATIFS